MTNPDSGIGRLNSAVAAPVPVPTIAPSRLPDNCWRSAVGLIICVHLSSSTTPMTSIATCNYPDRALMMPTGASPCTRLLTNWQPVGTMRSSRSTPLPPPHF